MDSFYHLKCLVKKDEEKTEKTMTKKEQVNQQSRTFKIPLNISIKNRKKKTFQIRWLKA